MSSKPRLLVPYGLKTLLEGLSRAVVSAQPTNIAHYASFYFMELLQYRQENPSMDFKDLVQEFQRRQENIQTQFRPAENSKLEISVPKDKAESEMVETKKGQCPDEQDPCAGNASLAALLKGALKYPLLHRDISNPLVSAHSVYSLLHPQKKASGSAVAERKDSVTYQPQEQTSTAVEASSEQNTEEPERLVKVSSKTQSQSRKNIEKKASVSGTVPKKSNNQALYTTSSGQDFDGQYSLPCGVPPNGRQTDGATARFSPPNPERNISKPQIVGNFPGDVQRLVSNMSQYPPDQAHSPAQGSAIYLAKQTVESQLPEVVPPTQGVAQLKIMSEPTENQQRITEMPSSNSYQILISVDKPVSKVSYEPAYIPGKDASMVHIVTAVPASRTSPTMVSAETASVHYKATPNFTPCETIQSPTLHCRHSTQDPVKYKSIYVQSQTGINQRCVCQKPLLSHLQQPTYRKTESSKYYVPYIQKSSNSPEAVRKEGYSDASSQSPELNQACSDSVQRNLMGSPGESEQANLWVSYQHGDLRQMDTSVNLQCRTELPPSRRPKYMEFLLCPCMSDPTKSDVQPVLITPPAYVVSDEAKLVASSPPYVVVGSSDWKTGYAVHPRNEQDFQKFTTMPVPFVSTKSNTGSQMQDLNFQHDPVYVSVAVPVEEVQRMSATPSITHLAETRSIPSFATQGNAIAIAVATTRCPSVMGGLDQKQCSRVKAPPDDKGYIRPSKTEHTIPH